MPELKEVFDMVTKQTEPDIDSWRDQEQRQRRTARNRKVGAFALVAAMVAATAVIGIIAMRPDDQERTGAPPPPIRTVHVVVDVATGGTSSVPESIDDASFFAVSADGERVAFQPFPGAIFGDSEIAIYVSNVDGTEVRRVSPERHDAFWPGWSPNNDEIVYQGRVNVATSERVGDLFVLDVATGSSTRLTQLEQISSPFWAMLPSYSADGDLVLFHKPRGPYGDQQSWDLWSIPSGGGEPTLIQRDAQYGADLGNGRIVYLSVVGGQARGLWSAEYDGSDPAQLVRGNIDAPMLSPDRTRVAYQQDGSVYVVDVSTGETAFVIRGEKPQWVDDGTLIVTPS